MTRNWYTKTIVNRLNYFLCLCLICVDTAVAKFLGGPASCHFESPSICGFTQDISGQDVFNWTRHAGPTTSSNTGPQVDHSTGTKAGMRFLR